MHEPRVVDGLLTRLEKESDGSRRQGLLTALCRLHSTEGTWKGESWGTRPDTRGPYYKIEAWSETPRISAALSNVLANAGADEAVFLASAFTRHRITPGDTAGRLLQLLDTNPGFVDAVAGYLATAEVVPESALPALSNAVWRSASPRTRADAAVALTKIDSARAMRVSLEALPVLWETTQLSATDLDRAIDALLGSPLLDKHHQVLLQTAQQISSMSGVAADAALIKLAGKSVDRRQKTPALAARSLDDGWQQPERRRQIIQAMAVAKDTSRAEQLVAALSDTNNAVKLAAEKTVQTLKINPARVKADAGRTLATMKTDDVLAAVQKTRGDVQRGEQAFTQAGCVACHTVKGTEPLKGPFLGNIATTYKRRELAEAILVPNKSIAQGFATHRFQLKDGEEVEGFVIQEAADKVTIRNVAAQEINIPVTDIAKREKVEKSLMPEGLTANLTLKDFASLLDYLEALATK
jgi:putative heme-binding domain-containing protein